MFLSEGHRVPGAAYVIREWLPWKCPIAKVHVGHGQICSQPTLYPTSGPYLTLRRWNLHIHTAEKKPNTCFARTETKIMSLFTVLFLATFVCCWNVELCHWVFRS